MYKPLLLALALFSAAHRAQAQVHLSVGPQLGYTLAYANQQLIDSEATNRYRSGFSGGLTAELGVGHLLVRPAVLYAQKGYNLAENSDGRFGFVGNSSRRTRIDYLAVPLNIGYAQHVDGQGFQVFAGAYVGFVLGGHYNTESDRTLPNGGSIHESYAGRVVADDNVYNNNDMLVRSTDVGVQAGIGYRYQNLLVQADYSMGLRNVNPHNFPLGGSYAGLSTHHNRVFQLSLAYLFGPKS